MTTAGRVGLGPGKAGIEVLWTQERPFLVVVPDVDGRYTACGIPSDRPVLFDVLAGPGYEQVSPLGWRQFGADTALDIEMKRIP